MVLTMGMARPREKLRLKKYAGYLVATCGAHGLVPQVKAESVPEGEAEGSDEDAESAPQLTPIDIGDALPDLILKNEKGEDVQVADIAKEKGAIVFLVPKADTRMFIDYPPFK